MSKRKPRHDRITCQHRLWAAWFMGAIDQHWPRRRLPLHPDLNREYWAGHNAALSGYLKLEDEAGCLEMLRFVQTGGFPHQFERSQHGMPL